MPLKDISECCNSLCSTKVTERKRSAELLLELIGRNHIVTLVNDNERFTWNNVVESVHNFLIKESDKLWETELKKKTTNATPLKAAGGDLLIRVVQVANTEKARIKASLLINLILSWYKSPNLKRYYSNAYIYIFKDFLSKQEYHGEISSSQWLDLLNLLKSLQNKSIPGLDNYKYLQCLLLLVQWGPINGLSGLALRQEFDFIIKLCKQFDSNCTRYVQESLLKILLEFCRHTAKDCRLSCCMLGESVMEYILRFYESTTCDNVVKLLLFEFLLLQINIHHPKGVPQNSSISCAYSWPNWNKQIRSIYTLLRSEINNNLNIRYKKSTLFVNYKNTKIINDTLVHVFIEAFKQVCENTNCDVSQTNINGDLQPLAKRQRVEITVTSLIQNIEDAQDWPWINILHVLLKKYPNLTKEDDFLFLLKTLSSLQVDCKDFDMQHHIYECLCVMVDVQKYLNNFMDVASISLLWVKVWESTVRATGLNQDNEQTNKLLQKLILNEKSLVMAQLFRTYFSGVNSVTEYSIKTLDIACYCYGLPEEDREKNTREILMRWILCFESDKSFNLHTLCHPSTAKVLTSLTLKQWPLYFTEMDDSETSKKTNAYIQDLYFKTNFESALDYNEKSTVKKENSIKTFSSHAEALATLYKTLNNTVEFIKTNTISEFQKLKHFTCLSILVINMTSHMVEYSILDEAKLQNCTSINLLNSLFEKISDGFCNITINIEENNFSHVVEVLNLFKVLFTTTVDQSVIELVREIFPVKLLQKLFSLLRNEDTETNIDVKQEKQLRILYLEVLCDYCCYQSQKLSVTQQFALETLTKLQLDEVYSDKYEENTIFLSSLRKYKPGSLNDEIITIVLEAIKRICIFHYSSNNTISDILDVLYDLYPHIQMSESGDIKEVSVKLLYPIYERYKNYSPQVTILLLKCLGRVIQLDTQLTWSKWHESGDIAKALPNFLCSEFQEVRFATIKTLSALFALPCNKKVVYFHQKEIIEKVISVLSKIFEVEIIAHDSSSTEEILSREREKDETTTRTATVIHVLFTIVVSSNMWRQRCFFALLQICEEKKILNSDLFSKALRLLANTLRVSNTVTLFELHLKYLIERWYKWKYNLNSFPYYLLDMDSLEMFYCKYKTIIVPFLVQFCSVPELEECCIYLKQPVLNVVEELYPKIMASCLPAFEETGVSNVTDKENKKKTYNNLISVLGIKKLSFLLQDKVDEVLLHLIDSVVDVKHFEDLFETSQVFFESDNSQLTVNDFQKIINYIQRKTTQGEALMQHHISCYPSKIQNILLHLKSNIYKATTIEEKLQKFHHFAVIVNMMLPSIKTENPMQEYLIRDICFALMNLSSENFHFYTTLNILAMRYLKIVLKTILPDCSKVLKKHLLVIVSILTPIAKCDSEIGLESLCVLKFLLVDNSVHLLSAIEALDPFPSDSKFEPLQKMYAKYQSKDTSLKYQINHFLNAGRSIMGNIGCRLEGLKNLTNALSVKKNELKILYSELYEMRGFSEDCQKSILHQLICMLVKLTHSNDSDIILEATKCLGEIGAADLTTLVLQTEPIQDGLKCGNQLELLTGNILSLLSQYVIDPNFDVMEASNLALYHVMNSKEAKIVIDSKKDYGFGTIDKSYLIPFIATTRVKTNLNVNVQDKLFEKEINSEELWCTSEDNSHDKWITNLVCSLLKCFNEKCYLSHLLPVCKAKVSFCEKLFPALIYVLLHTNNKSVISIICKNMKTFLTRHWNLRRLRSQQKSEEICINKASAQCFLNVINFARLQDNLSLKKKIADLKLDYLKVAFVAQFCSAHFTSLLYAELWCEEKISEIQCTQKETCRGSKLDLLIQTQEEVFVETLQNILKEAYKAIGDFDALHGCGLSHLLDIQSRIEHYKQQGRWGQVAQFYEVEVAHGKSEAFNDLMHSLKNSCMYQLPILCSSDSETDYECLWRLSKWNASQNQHTFNVQKENNFEKLRYMALKSLFEINQYAFVTFIKDARYSIIESLKHASLESSKNLYPYLMQLQSLQEIEDVAFANTNNNFEALFDKWKLHDSINPNDFQYIEPIRAQRIAVLNSFLKSSEVSLKEALIKFNLEVSNLARKEGYLNVANRVMACVSQINVINLELKAKIMYEEAQLCWANNDKTTGKYLLKRLIDLNGNSPSLRCLALRLYGIWMIETHSENAQSIIINYFLKSLDINRDHMEKSAETLEMKSETCNVLAQFADKKYQQVLSYIESTVFEQKVKNMERSKHAAQELSKAEKTQDVRRALAIHLKHNAIDNNEIMNTYKEKDAYLILSVKYYTINLQNSDIQNENIFRVISLWLENRNNTQLTELLQKQLPEIPSYKFITLLPQLIPHLTNNDDDSFGKGIGAIIERCAIEHPHHTLPVILALAYSNKDRSYTNSDTNTSSNESRVRGANILLDKLKERPNFRNLINKMEKLSEALIELAYTKDNEPSKRENARTIPYSCKIRKIKNYDDVLLPTYTLSIKKNGNYHEIIGISSFDDKYNNVGGINAPKRITCRGTDGIIRTQLVKGQDDLRQDAVMQQVFTIMNRLLANNKQTNKLLIRTYKIVPLSMRSGILEWVVNTTPIGEYLIGDNGAHLKYGRTKDYNPSKCRALFKAAGDKKTLEEKLDIYNTICDNFKPVFHKFFETSFPQATVWYERRQAYMHSVATSSMCGYILGLGDRHVQNILIDLNTAEVIHIDFGIAFEQGRVLPTPETVPFRLSRDIEDGMGVSGVEGVFRRSCEKSMEVLRQNGQTIITILEVLLYDPLYAWTVSAAEAYSRQQDDDDVSMSFSDAENVNINVTAKRALLRLRNKLHGTEEGVSSIESQVEKLIQQARDPANLCRLFHGWQPYL